jgi:hypothetical protein
MSKKKTKFQLGDHVTYSNKRGKYSYIGEVIAKEGRYCVVEIQTSTGNVLFKGRKDVNDWTECIPEKFDLTSDIWGSRKSISSDCVWDSSQFLHHVMKPYDIGQNGDTDDDI